MNNFLLSINLMSTICPALLFFTFSATDRVAPDDSDAKQRLESGWSNICNNVESETAGLQNSDDITENLYFYYHFPRKNDTVFSFGWPVYSLFKRDITSKLVEKLKLKRYILRLL